MLNFKYFCYDFLNFNYVKLFDYHAYAHQALDRINYRKAAGVFIGAYVTVLAHQRRKNLAHLGGAVAIELEELLDYMVLVLDQLQWIIRGDRGNLAQFYFVAGFDKDYLVAKLGSEALHAQSCINQREEIGRASCRERV